MTLAEELEKEMNNVDDKKSSEGTAAAAEIVNGFKGSGKVRSTFITHLIDREMFIEMNDGSLVALLQTEIGTGIFAFTEQQSFFIALIMKKLEELVDEPS